MPERAKMALVLGALLGVILSCTTDQAIARILLWELDGVVFDDGATASGFFKTESDAVWSPSGWNTSPVVGWDITVQGGTRICTNPFCNLDYRFDSTREGSGILSPEKSVLVVYSHTFFNLDRLGRLSLELQLTFDSPLSEAGLTRTVGGFEDWTYYVGVTRSVTGGNVVAIPEPAALLCLCVCLALLAGFSGHRPLWESG